MSPAPAEDADLLREVKEGRLRHWDEFEDEGKG